MKKGIELLDLLFILRPMLFYPVWTFYLAGLWASQRSKSGTDSYNSVIVLLSLSLVIGAVFILNQIKDKKTDRINKKLFLIANDIVSVKTAYIEAGVLVGAGFLICAFVSIKILLMLAALFILSGWAYNFSPFRWKDRPVMGMVTNSLSGLLIYSLGWVTFSVEGILPVNVIPYALAGAAVYLDTTLPDMKGDRAADKNTFSVRYGVAPTIRLASFLEIASVVSAYLVSDWIIFYAGLVVLPVYILSALKPDLINAVRAIKFSVILLLSGVCYFFPILLVVVAVTFFITKWYYKKRFNFNYPNLKASDER